MAFTVVAKKRQRKKIYVIIVVYSFVTFATMTMNAMEKIMLEGNNG